MSFCLKRSGRCSKVVLDTMGVGLTSGTIISLTVEIEFYYYKF